MKKLIDEVFGFIDKGETFTLSSLMTAAETDECADAYLIMSSLVEDKIIAEKKNGEFCGIADADTVLAYRKRCEAVLGEEIEKEEEKEEDDDDDDEFDLDKFLEFDSHYDDDEEDEKDDDEDDDDEDEKDDDDEDEVDKQEIHDSDRLEKMIEEANKTVDDSDLSDVSIGTKTVSFYQSHFFQAELRGDNTEERVIFFLHYTPIDIIQASINQDYIDSAQLFEKPSDRHKFVSEHYNFDRNESAFYLVVDDARFLLEWDEPLANSCGTTLIELKKEHEDIVFEMKIRFTKP